MFMEGGVVEEYPKLREFDETFRMRQGARRDADAGVVASEEVLARMMTWAKGSI
jgi:hypothetical protein